MLTKARNPNEVAEEVCIVAEMFESSAKWYVFGHTTCDMFTAHYIENKSWL